MEAYLKAFVNWEQDDWARLLPMAEFAYNNAKNASTNHTPFELNCDYYPRVFFKEDVNPHSRSYSADELAEKLRELIEACYQNLFHAQELQKRAYNKRVKSQSYATADKVWLNSEYIKTKRNKKLESKFFGPFRVLHALGKQAYKLELPTKWKIYNVFHVSLLKQDTTRKGPVDKALTEPERIWNLRSEAIRSTRSRQSLIAWCTASRQTAIKRQASTTSFCERTTQKKKTSGSLHWQSYTSRS